MKEKENSRILERQEKLLLVDELVEPAFIREGKMIPDKNLILVNQVIKKAEQSAVMIDPEIESFFKWVIEIFDNRVEMYKGAKIFKVSLFIWFDQNDEHIKIDTINEDKEKDRYVVDTKGYAPGCAIVNKTLDMIGILKNFDFSNACQEGEYKGWPYRIRDIVMHL